MIERNIRTETHGRYLVLEPAANAPLLVGFHGYAETAEHEIERLRSIPGGERWLRLAVQGLNRFYRGRSSDVVAGWMTTQDRLLAIADNRAYVSRVIAEVRREWNTAPGVVFSGFSQGVAMAFRAADAVEEVRGVIACGGDVPPELDASALSRLKRVLIGRGTADEWYSEEKLCADEKRLHDAGVEVQIVRFSAGHEWTGEFAAAAAGFLNDLQAA